MRAAYISAINPLIADLQCVQQSLLQLSPGGEAAVSLELPGLPVRKVRLAPLEKSFWPLDL